MKVVEAEHLGMCFGVRDAVDLARRLEAPHDVTIHGDLVHNEEVLAELARRGFHLTPEKLRNGPPPTPRVLVTAHGLSALETDHLRQAGKQIVDATCPLVRRVHRAAQALERQGYFVVVIGKQSHVEVRGIVGDLHDYAVIDDPAEALPWPAERIGVVCQTTTPPAVARQVRQAIEAANPGKAIRFIDTVCRPTRDRQEAVERLLDEVDALVVVGGRHSHNTKRLGEMAAARGLPWVQVQTAGDLDADWCRSFAVLGLTAGTSTPDETVAAVREALRGL